MDNDLMADMDQEKKRGVGRNERWIKSVLAWVCLSGAGVTVGKAQYTYDVFTFAQLQSAINQANLATVAAPTATSTINILSNLSGTAQMFVNANVTIDAGGYSLDMQNMDRAFFVAGGTVAISNLTIMNGNATGGDGVQGGGGGMGAGGAIFVGSGTYPTANDTPAAKGVSAPVVTLSKMQFVNNRAAGGSGSFLPNSGADQGGGGGGMGGDGGNGYDGFSSKGGGGGGGFGNGAFGGFANSDSPQGGTAGAFMMTNGNGADTSGGNGAADESGDLGGGGGFFGGGGGGANASLDSQSAGGGGGVGGQSAIYDDLNTSNGGWGGGGGGGLAGTIGVAPNGGKGGFGGGGGGSVHSSDPSNLFGAGGFGGGGGAPTQNIVVPGGFGASNGFYVSDSVMTGGGGLGAGGALFVMKGASVTIVQDASASGTLFLENAVEPGVTGVAGQGGSAIGANIFLGGDVTFNVSGTTTLESLGGGGNVSENANDPNAQGGIIKEGAGTLVLTGTNSYSGATVINRGTLSLAAGAIEQGTTGVVVGGSNSSATLVLGDGATLGTSGTITLGPVGGGTGTLIIGTGGGSLLSGSPPVISGGAGGGTVIFDDIGPQPGGGSYQMNSILSGNLSVVQNSSGTTVLAPIYVLGRDFGYNSYGGGTVVNAGVLQVGSGSLVERGLPPGSDLTVNGGTFDINGQQVFVDVLALNGGTLDDSAGGGSLEVAAINTVSGRVKVSLGGTVALVQSAGGTTYLEKSSTYSGGTTINGGVLQIANKGGLGNGGVQVNGGVLSVRGGEAITNAVTLSGGEYTVEVKVGGSYAGMADAVSDFGNGRSTGASLLAGVSGTGAMLETSFATSSEALNDVLRVSDVYRFAGTEGDVYVLELSMSSVEAESVLGWLNPGTHEWEIAVNGNTGNNASAEEMGYEGSFAAFQLANGTDLSLYLGAYGVDVVGGEVWAVLNHNSDFAILAVPEPGSLELLMAGGVGLLAVRRWRRRLTGIVNKS